MSSPVQNKRVIKKKNSHVDRISQLILGLPKNRTIRFWWRIRHALSHSTRSGRSRSLWRYVAAGNSIWGSIIATFAVCLPSFILVLLVSRFILKHKDNITIKSIFSGLRPVVVGLIASAALLLMNKENFPDYTISIGIAVISFVLVHYAKIHPILVIVLAGISGYALY